MALNKDFREFIVLLNENQVKYMIVGGYAVGFHGYPRYTKDLDIWITNNFGVSASWENVLFFAKAFETLYSEENGLKFNYSKLKIGILF